MDQTGPHTPSQREWLGLFIGGLAAVLVIAVIVSSVGSFLIINTVRDRQRNNVRASIAAAACADKPGTQTAAQITACVRAVLGPDFPTP